MSGSGLDPCGSLPRQRNASGCCSRLSYIAIIIIVTMQKLPKSIVLITKNGGNPQSYGKLTYFITLFPYVVLTTFLIIGCFEDGFVTGITEYYLKVQNCYLKVQN